MSVAMERFKLSTYSAYVKSEIGYLDIPAHYMTVDESGVWFWIEEETSDPAGYRRKVQTGFVPRDQLIAVAILGE